MEYLLLAEQSPELAYRRAAILHTNLVKKMLMATLILVICYVLFALPIGVHHGGITVS